MKVYFDEAGEAEEASVIQKLGSPGKVAAIIKADLKENSSSAGTYTEKGYYDERTEEPGQVPGERTAAEKTEVTAPERNGAVDDDSGTDSSGVPFTVSVRSHRRCGWIYCNHHLLPFILHLELVPE